MNLQSGIIIFDWSDSEKFDNKILEGRASMLAFSPDGRLIISHDYGYINRVGLWDVATGERKWFDNAVEENDASIGSVTILPDNQTLAIGMSDSTILLWDLDP